MDVTNRPQDRRTNPGAGRIQESCGHAFGIYLSTPSEESRKSPSHQRLGSIAIDEDGDRVSKQLVLVTLAF